MPHASTVTTPYSQLMEIQDQFQLHASQLYTDIPVINKLPSRAFNLRLMSPVCHETETPTRQFNDRFADSSNGQNFLTRRTIECQF